jgi:hypothetical protein
LNINSEMYLCHMRRQEKGFIHAIGSVHALRHAADRSGRNLSRGSRQQGSCFRNRPEHFDSCVMSIPPCLATAPTVDYCRPKRAHRSRIIATVQNRRFLQSFGLARSSRQSGRAATFARMHASWPDGLNQMPITLFIAEINAC